MAKTGLGERCIREGAPTLCTCFKASVQTQGPASAEHPACLVGPQAPWDSLVQALRVLGSVEGSPSPWPAAPRWAVGAQLRAEPGWDPLCTRGQRPAPDCTVCPQLAGLVAAVRTGVLLLQGSRALLPTLRVQPTLYPLLRHLCPCPWFPSHCEPSGTRLFLPLSHGAGFFSVSKYLTSRSWR